MVSVTLTGCSRAPAGSTRPATSAKREPADDNASGQREDAGVTVERTDAAPAGPAVPVQVECAKGLDSMPLSDLLAAAGERCVPGMRPLLVPAPRVSLAAPDGGEIALLIPKAGCVRVGVAVAGSARVSVSIEGNDGAIARVEARGPLVMAPADGPVCVADPGSYRLQIAVVGDAATTATVEAWQAAD